MEKELIIIIDFGGKYVQLIARQIRQFNVYCEILPYSTDFERIKAMAPKGFIFTGNVVDMNNPDVIEWTNRIHDLGLPIMSIDNLKASDNLKDFLYNTCHCSGSWRMSSYVELSIRRLKEKIGDQKVLCALSGGVDSSVAAVMISKAVGKQLTCIFVDHGLLRKNEADEVEEIFSNQFDLNLIRVNAQDRFYNKLAGVTDPESKRKIIGEEFIRVFEDEAKKIGRVDYLVQGTIYPDIIECGVGSGLVKSHHNVG